MCSLKALGIGDVSIGKGFWGDRQRLVAESVLPYQWKALNDEIPGAEPSHAIENLRIVAGLSSGKLYSFQFQNSEIAKWIEAASYSLASRPDPELERHVDEAIELIGSAQESDGYIQSYYSITSPGKRWTDLEWGHELYSGGHLIEAAVAHYSATGSRKLLDIMLRYVDCVDRSFGREEGKRRGYDGHPEIELALFRLYGVTGDEKQLRLARYFVDERGQKPCYFDAERAANGSGKRERDFELDYFQAQAPVREQRSAEGHAVRGVYLYSAMAEYAAITGDLGLRASLSAIWESATGRRMYVTGALGSQHRGERHTIDYDLPSDTAYAETCASIGLVFWAWRMLLLDPDSRYADVLERALYNGVLSGMSADGTRFFYVNPLAAIPAVARVRFDQEATKTRRVQWFGCSCCPPNIARLVGSIGAYAYTYDGASVWVHNYISGEATFPAEAGGLRLSVDTEYPWEGRVALRIESGGGQRALRLRVPSWSASFVASLNGQPLRTPKIEKGYLVVDREWTAGDRLELELDMAVRFLYSRPEVAETAGMACAYRGPLVLCAEEADDGPGLLGLEISPVAPAKAMKYDLTCESGKKVESIRVEVGGRRALPVPEGAPLYGSAAPRYEERPIVLIPYFQWANRVEGEMRVWLRCRA
jgi:uncharacterized protein